MYVHKPAPHCPNRERLPRGPHGATFMSSDFEKNNDFDEKHSKTISVKFSKYFYIIPKINFTLKNFQTERSRFFLFPRSLSIQL